MNLSPETLLALHDRIEVEFSKRFKRAATDFLQKEIILSIHEALEEFNSDDLEIRWTLEQKTKWVRTLLSGIQTSNEQVEDDENGFQPIFDGPFKVEKINLNEQILKLSKILEETITKISGIHDNLDLENDKYQKQTIQEASKDPVLSQITIPFAKQKLDNLDKQSKKRRMHWNGFLDELLNMLNNFEEKRDSDVEEGEESSSEED